MAISQPSPLKSAASAELSSGQIHGRYDNMKRNTYKPLKKGNRPNDIVNGL